MDQSNKENQPEGFHVTSPGSHGDTEPDYDNLHDGSSDDDVHYRDGDDDEDSKLCAIYT